MPDIKLRDDCTLTGYSMRTHIWSAMFFPGRQHAARRELFWQAQLRSLLVADLHDRFVRGAGEIAITRQQFETLLTVPSPAALLKAREETTIRRAGFLAANCLRFMMAATLACKTSPEHAWLLQVNAWKAYLLTVPFKTARNDEEGPLAAILKDTPPQYRQLIAIRRDFLAVAHFWAARYNDDGTGTEPETQEQFEDFLARAEGYRLLAEELGVYTVAWQGESPIAPIRIITEVDMQELIGQRRDSDDIPRSTRKVKWGGRDVELPAIHVDDSTPVPTGRTWTETAFKLTPIRPRIEPLPEGIIAEVAKTFRR